MQEFQKSDKKDRKRITITAITCIAYLLLTIFFYHIDKHLTGVLFIIVLLLIPLTFVMMFFFVIKGVVQVFRNRKALHFKTFVPIFIVLITLTYTFFSPWRLDSENLESRVLQRACFEGTQNQATLKFRQDNSFEIHWTGVFGYDAWFYGTYTQKADTIYLHYETERPLRFGDTIVNDRESLITINKIKREGTLYYTPFYLGYCKGLN